MAIFARMIIVCALAACAPTRLDRPHADRCESSVAMTPDIAADAFLTGTFRVVQVDTTRGAGSDNVRAFALTLATVDAAARAASQTRRFAYVTRTNLRSAGWYTGGGAGNQRDTAEVNGSTLYLGCRDCLDASPDMLQITTASQTAFAGTWHNPMSGIATARDASGNPLPDPAGFFCATRTEETPRSDETGPAVR